MKMTKHMSNTQWSASGKQQLIPEECCKSAWAVEVARDADARLSASEVEETPANVQLTQTFTCAASQVPQIAYTDTQNMNPQSTVDFGQLPHPEPFHNKTLEDFRLKCSRVISSFYFEPVVGVVILANAICLGITIDVELRKESTLQWVILEHIFLIIFTVEFSLTIFVHGFKCLWNGWNMFDFLVIMGGIFSQWVLVPIMSSQGLEEHILVKMPQQLLIFRMLRLLRLVRAVRLMSSFKALWKLTQGFLNCAPTMLSSALVLIMTLYVFSCVGAEFIAKERWEDEAVAALVQTHFNSLPLIMLSLVQFVNADSIAGLYFPLIAQRPALAVYFGSLILLVSLALMNLVTALVVEDAISSARMDDEMMAMYNKRKMKKMRPSLSKMFKRLDTSNDGTIQIDEIIRSIRQGINVPRDLQDYVTEDRVVDLFDAFDEDGDGKLVESEFIDGLSKLVLQDVPVETTQMLHMLRSTLGKIEKMEHQLCTLVQSTPCA